MKRNAAVGFTLLELSIVLSIAALLAPIAFMVVREVEAQHREALSRIEAAQAMRTFSEALRADLALWYHP